MPTSLIAFFSSDAQELYKADVYRALALPVGSVLHFRYERKYIQSDLLSKLSSLKNAKGLIFFVSGNDLNLQPNQRNLQSHSIRLVTIKEIVEDQNLDSLHFYLELEAFADYSAHPGTSPDLLPPTTFVSQITVDDGPNKGWSDRVKRVAQFFPKLMFFTIQGVSQNGSPVLPSYNSHTRTSEYHVYEETAYQCEVTFFDPENRGTGLEVSTNNAAVQFVVPPNHRLGAQRDTTTFDIQTHTIPQNSLICFSHLTDRLGHYLGTPMPDAWRVELKWIVGRGRGRTIWFGLASSIAALGLILAKVATDDLSKIITQPFWPDIVQAAWPNLLAAVVALGLVGFSAGYLYEFFNKK